VQLFFEIAILFFGVIIGLTTLSYAAYWYESANCNPELILYRFRLAQLVLAAGLILGEAACLMVTILLQPAGWFNRKLPPITREQTPIILLHGLFQSRACWWWLKLNLRRRGHTALYAISLPPWKDVEVLTERLAKTVDTLRHRHGVSRVHLLGHSMGALIARNYLQIRGGAGKIERCVFLGAPHGGSKLAPFALSPLGLLLVPGSAFLQRLAAAAWPDCTGILNIYSIHDNMVLPAENAFLAGTSNEELSGVGHASLLFYPSVVRRIIAYLEEPQP
jgi:pimeloyl-ACP methyl ester carboxylesterase